MQQSCAMSRSQLQVAICSTNRENGPEWRLVLQSMIEIVYLLLY